MGRHSWALIETVTLFVIATLIMVTRFGFMWPTSTPGGLHGRGDYLIAFAALAVFQGLALWVGAQRGSGRDSVARVLVLLTFGAEALLLADTVLLDLPIPTMNLVLEVLLGGLAILALRKIAARARERRERVRI